MGLPRHAGLHLTHISYLAILPPHRAQGLGGVLMERLGALAGRRVLLDAEDPERIDDPQKREAAEKRLAFYRRCGYRVYRRLYDKAYGLPISGALIK